MFQSVVHKKWKLFKSDRYIKAGWVAIAGLYACRNFEFKQLHAVDWEKITENVSKHLTL